MLTAPPLLGSTIIRPNKSDVMTALGAGVAAAISVGIDPTALLSLRLHEGGEQEANTFRPNVDQKTRKMWMRGYKNAVKRSLSWTTDNAADETDDED